MSNLAGMRSFGHLDSSFDIRPLMRGVYGWMTVGLLVTAGVAYLVSTSSALMQLALNPAALLIAFVIELILVFVLSAAVRRLSPGAAMILFLLYAAVNGFTLSLILFSFSTGTLTLAFVSAAATFAAMTVVGFTTKLDLGRYSTYLFMGVIGLMIALVLNLFLNSSGLDLLLSIVGVLLFSGLTAYDTQRIQRLAANVEGDNASLTPMSIRGALFLYLDLINLFLFFVRIFGRRR